MPCGLWTINTLFYLGILKPVSNVSLLCGEPAKCFNYRLGNVPFTCSSFHVWNMAVVITVLYIVLLFTELIWFQFFIAYQEKRKPQSIKPLIRTFAMLYDPPHVQKQTRSVHQGGSGKLPKRIDCSFWARLNFLEPVLFISIPCIRHGIHSKLPQISMQVCTHSC